MCIVGSIPRVILLGAFTLAVFSLQPATAAVDEPLQEAQKLEANGQYFAAASAYLSIIEGFDFMPGKSRRAVLSNNEKAILGKCAIDSLEQGIREHMAFSEARIEDCAELMLVPAACHTMSELEPSNPRWKSVNNLKSLYPCLQK